MAFPLAMEWRDFLFVHYPIDPDYVEPLVPPSLELDTFDDRAWVSVIPFVNERVRPAFVPGELGIRLPELNVRTYVTFEGTEAIYFFSLDADGLMSVLAARWFHHLPYFNAKITHTVDGECISFSSRRTHPGARSASLQASYRPNGPAVTVSDGSRSAFLLQRHRFYTEDTYGRLRYTDVTHDPWRVAPASADISGNTMVQSSGIPDPDEPPILQYSPGLSVRIQPSRLVRSGKNRNDREQRTPHDE